MLAKSLNVYHATVKRLYDFLIKNSSAQNSYEQWKPRFTYLHGFLDKQKKIDLTEIKSNYNISFVTIEDTFQFIFCLETLYTIILRTIAYSVVYDDKTVNESSFKKETFEEKGVKNYGCETHFDWFLKIDNFDILVKEIGEDLNNTYLKNRETDFIKEIFENIFPSSIRHSMGEFYTPDWLAKFVINNLTLNDHQAYNKTYLDPACGSGTFLFNIAKKFQKQSGGGILKNIFGLDLNPVSVLAAKTNYLLLYKTSFNFDKNKPVYIPIFYADSITVSFTKKNFTVDQSQEYETINIPQVDYIVGNPPWVNWEYLPEKYKKNTINIWQHYGLFNLTGIKAGFIKEDISVLFTYVVLDKYLKDQGKLGFIVKETLFKSINQGEGFRRFKILPANIPLNPYQVHDLTAFKPFNGAVNRTALVFIKKGEKVKYPVDYIFWQPIKAKNCLENNCSLNELNQYFKFQCYKAKPSDLNNLASGWITLKPELIDLIDKVLGISFYQARTGMFTGGANGIFWLEIKNKKENLITIRNITQKAKNKFEPVEKDLETEFIFPLLTGSELRLWDYNYSQYILCPHTYESKMYPINFETLKQFPFTFEYLEYFKDELKNRKGFTSFDKKIHLSHYYALQRIGEYTFAKYKVAWRYISKKFITAVIEYTNDQYLGYKNIIPNEKIIFVGLNNQEEAYYLCGLLSSNIYCQTIESYMVDTQITPSIIERLNLPPFDKDNSYHQKISWLCQQGHKNNPKQFYLEQLNKVVEDLVLNTKHTTTLFLL
jgi:SAM-dependent methyltransferase